MPEWLEWREDVSGYPNPGVAPTLATIVDVRVVGGDETSPGIDDGVDDAAGESSRFPPGVSSVLPPHPFITS